VTECSTVRGKGTGRGRGRSRKKRRRKKVGKALDALENAQDCMRKTLGIMCLAPS